MKKILVLGLLFVQGLFAQVPENVEYLTIPLTISTKSIANVATDSAGYWLVLTNGLGAPVDTGQYVWGEYIQPGTQVVAITGTGLNDSVRVSKPILDNVTETVMFGVLNTTTYAAGDVLGWSARVGKVTTIWNAMVVDSCDQIATTTPLDLHFYDARPAVQIDSTTMNTSDAEGVSLCGEIVFPIANDLGGIRMALPERNTTKYTFPLVLTKRDGKDDVWVRAIARGALAVPTNINCLVLKLAVTR